MPFKWLFLFTLSSCVGGTGWGWGVRARDWLSVGTCEAPVSRILQPGFFYSEDFFLNSSHLLLHVWYTKQYVEDKMQNILFLLFLTVCNWMHKIVKLVVWISKYYIVPSSCLSHLLLFFFCAVHRHTGGGPVVKGGRCLHCITGAFSSFCWLHVPWFIWFTCLLVILLTLCPLNHLIHLPFRHFALSSCNLLTWLWS